MGSAIEYNRLNKGVVINIVTKLIQFLEYKEYNYNFTYANKNIKKESMKKRNHRKVVVL